MNAEAPELKRFLVFSETGSATKYAVPVLKETAAEIITPSIFSIGLVAGNTRDRNAKKVRWSKSTKRIMADAKEFDFFSFQTIVRHLPENKYVVFEGDKK